MSNTDRSKVRSNICDRRSSGPIAYRSTAASTNARTLRCVTITPFGVPVLPDVKSRYASASGSTATDSSAAAGTMAGGRQDRVPGPAPAQPRRLGAVVVVGQQDDQRVLQPVQERVEAPGRAGVGDDGAAAGALEHGPAALRGMVGMQRHVAVAAHERAENPGERRRAARPEDRGQRRAGTGVRALERRGDRRRAVVERQIGEGGAAHLQRGTAAVAPHRLQKALQQGNTVMHRHAGSTRAIAPSFHRGAACATRVLACDA